MELVLNGKVAIVTGSSRGIGKAIAFGLLLEGCKVVINSREKKDLKKVEEDFAEYKESLLAIEADLTKNRDVKKLVEKTVEKFGTIHILVNNAGSNGRVAGFGELSDDEWNELYDINLTGAVRLCKEVIPHMQKNNWGRIINISSESGIQPDADMPHYNASKAALINLSKSLARAYAKDGILVNTVSAAFIKTPMVESMLEQMAEQQEKSVEKTEKDFLNNERPFLMLKRPGKPEEVANVVVFLASEASSFVTATNWMVDGGSVLAV